jgi:hypothetical protein
MTITATPVLNRRLEQDIAGILEFLYGDKTFHMPRNHPDELFSLATHLGYIDTEGRLTRKGRTLLARHT